MCDMCTSTDPEFKSAPGTPERAAELKARTMDRIMEYGHEIICVMDGDPAFFYTVGRSVMDRPELFLTVDDLVDEYASTVPAGVLNIVARADNEGAIDLKSISDREVLQQEDWPTPLAFIHADPVAALMSGAIELSGVKVESLQVVWPDDDGRFPWDEGFVEKQPLYPLNK